MGVKDHRRRRRLVAINNERVAGRALRHDRVGQLFRAEHRLKARKGDVRRDQKTRHGQRNAHGGRHVLAFQPQRQPTTGPTSNTIAARTAGSRSAANEAPVRSNRCDIDSV